MFYYNSLTQKSIGVMTKKLSSVLDQLLSVNIPRGAHAPVFEPLQLIKLS